MATKSCGTFFWFMYLWIAVLHGVPSVWNSAKHLVLLDQLADHLDGLGRLIAVVVADEVDLAAVDAAGPLTVLK